jgi:transcriptional regulator with XRE-family HTH domain
MKVDGEKIRHLRESKVLTMHEVCMLAGVSYNTLYRLETGKSEARQSTIRKIARVLGIDAATLVVPSKNGGRENTGSMGKPKGTNRKEKGPVTPNEPRPNNPPLAKEDMDAC